MDRGRSGRTASLGSRVVQVTFAGRSFSAGPWLCALAIIWTARPGNAPASLATSVTAALTVLARAACRRGLTARPLPGTCSRASTGRHAGRVQNGKATTIPAVTKQYPKLSLLRAGDDPPCCHAAPKTLRPDRRNTRSSTATVIAPPGGTSSDTTIRATARSSSSSSQEARAKK